MLIPDMCCNRGDIKTDAWHMFYLCNGKCVGGEDPVTQIRAAAMVMSPGALLEGACTSLWAVPLEFFLTSSFE